MSDVRELQLWELPAGQRCWSGSLTTHADFVEANELYGRVFGYGSSGHSLNTNLLSALVRNGGSAVGIRDEDSRLIGFAYGFTGFDGITPYHYSQATVIDAENQGQGIGRILKSCQRDLAHAQGINLMRWTFDPLLARNAHFNFNSLGATGIGFARDYYDRPDTDRIIVQWTLDARSDPHLHERGTLPPAGLEEADFGTPIPDGRNYWIPLPAGLAAGPDHRPDHTRTSAHLRAGLEYVFDAGYLLVGCQRLGPTASAYLAAPAAPPSKELR